ncbi:flagellin [Motilimonas sp. 1_MG-2023]|uniref:flagellin n=1 Tax=Motilimonas sp. 1_MG-2023 TaxID=3062672 RepID=UPI0026E33B10|nr:flagellin [Motilimonas sp. 1_MG-2023]MDO6524116.1 flagellin [Motilimonas sp. 1_MG-2023]
MQIGSTSSFQSSSLISQQKKKEEEENEKLASGKRINSAADDAAGFSISQRLTSQINQSAQLNANETYNQSLASTESSGLQNSSASVQRINELVVASGNGINGANELGAIQSEINELVSGIDNASSLGLDTINVTTQSVDANLATGQAAQEQLLSSQSDLGAQINASDSYQRQLSSAFENQSAARSRIEDADYAQVSSDQSKAETLLEASVRAQKEKEENEKNAVTNLLG